MKRVLNYIINRALLFRILFRKWTNRLPVPEESDFVDYTGQEFEIFRYYTDSFYGTNDQFFRYGLKELDGYSQRPSGANYYYSRTAVKSERPSGITLDVGFDWLNSGYYSGCISSRHEYNNFIVSIEASLPVSPMSEGDIWLSCKGRRVVSFKEVVCHLHSNYVRGFNVYTIEVWPGHIRLRLNGLLVGYSFREEGEDSYVIALSSCPCRKHQNLRDIISGVAGMKLKWFHMYKINKGHGTNT